MTKTNKINTSRLLLTAALLVFATSYGLPALSTVAVGAEVDVLGMAAHVWAVITGLSYLADAQKITDYGAVFGLLAGCANLLFVVFPVLFVWKPAWLQHRVWRWLAGVGGVSSVLSVPCSPVEIVQIWTGFWLWLLAWGLLWVWLGLAVQLASQSSGS